MSAHWPEVALGDVLAPVSRSESVDATKQYRLLGVRLDGRGPFLRETVLGSESAATRLFRVERNDFIYSRLFAWRGAFGVIADDLHDCYVSGEFPTFLPCRDLIDVQFLRLWFRLPATLAKVDEYCSGSTPLTRNRFKEHFFLRLKLPLPSLAEQQRIVERIEDLADRIRAARSLRSLAAYELDAVLDGIERRIWPTESLASARTLAEVTTFLARGRHSEQGESNHRLIKTQHVQQGHYVPTAITLAPHVAPSVAPAAVARTGDVLIACSAAGCLGRVARYQDDGYAASTDTHVAIARANQDMIEPEYLYVYLRGATGQHQLRSRERGDWEREKIGFRLTELNLKDLKNVPVPLPDKPTQRRLVAVIEALYSQVKSVRRLQTETAAEIEALLPAILDRAFKGEL